MDSPLAMACWQCLGVLRCYKLKPNERKVAEALLAEAARRGDGRVWIRSTGELGKACGLRSDRARVALKALIEMHLVTSEGGSWFFVQPDPGMWQVGRVAGIEPDALARQSEKAGEDVLLLADDMRLGVGLGEGEAGQGRRPKDGGQHGTTENTEDTEAVGLRAEIEERDNSGEAAPFDVETDGGGAERPSDSGIGNRRLEAGEDRRMALAQEWRQWIQSELRELLPDMNTQIACWRQWFNECPGALRYAIGELRAKVAEERNGGEVIGNRGKFLNAVYWNKRREIERKKAAKG